MPKSGEPERRTSETALHRTTGRDRHEWFAVLDAWGAADHEYREIAAFLTGEHGVSAWWAQKLTVEYEEARGLRDPGVRRDGTFSVTASKSIAAPAERVFAAFVEANERERWLPGVALRERTSQPGRSVRFDWGDGSTRLNVGIERTGNASSEVAVEHERLLDLDAAARQKAYWRDRLTALKRLLED